MMTIHSSKGLESHSSFILDYQDVLEEMIYRPVILNQSYGLGMTYYDVDSRLSYPSLSSVTYKAIAEKEMV